MLHKRDSISQRNMPLLQFPPSTRTRERVIPTWHWIGLVVVVVVVFCRVFFSFGYHRIEGPYHDDRPLFPPVVAEADLGHFFMKGQGCLDLGGCGDDRFTCSCCL